MSTTRLINDALKAFYTRHPYPRYPLVGRPIWEHGLSSSPAYSWRMAHPDRLFQNSSTVLLMGCGEILPYITSKWDKTSRFECVDISKRSIRRAYWRTAVTNSHIKFFSSDIDRFLSQKPNHSFHHVDTYGVLHHLANPSRTLAETVRVLKPGGTIRLMVYNSRSRDWIRHFQKIFQLLKYSGFKKRDLESAASIVRSTLNILGRRDWVFALKPTFKNLTRFADAFFNVREARLDLNWWMKQFELNGLTVVSLFDRYGELDDLNNPAWSPPKMSDLEIRTKDRRFENNLELILVKNEILVGSEKAAKHPLPLVLNRFMIQHPLWFSFIETAPLSRKDRKTIIENLTSFINTGKTSPDWWKSIPIDALQRLARLGVILPGMAMDKSLHAKLLEPISDHMDIPTYATLNDEQMANLMKFFDLELKKDPNKELKLKLISKHLEKI
jgi:ubiquinone/menaquinone biosynthesis C-methylase UbiE